MEKRDLAYLKSKARKVREGIVRAIGVGQKGHLGGSMSSADLVTALYFYKMRHWPDNKPPRSGSAHLQQGPFGASPVCRAS